MCLVESKPVEGSPKVRAYKTFYTSKNNAKIVEGTNVTRKYRIGQVYRATKKKKWLYDSHYEKYRNGFHAWTAVSSARKNRCYNDIYEVEIGEVHTQGRQYGQCIVGNTMKIIKRITR